MKIVIVEDDPGIRKELQQLLENAFCQRRYTPPAIKSGINSAKL